MEKIFINGLISKEVDSKAPAFILGKHSIKVDDLITWLQTEGKKYAVNGWINTTTLLSKGGKRYIELDLYEYNKTQQKPATNNYVDIGHDYLTNSIYPINDTGEVSPSDIPF